MGRRSSNGSVIMLIVYLIWFAFVIIGYCITFLEKIHKYHLWKNFWLTFLLLLITNYMGYTLLNTNLDISISLFIISWLVFIIYLGCKFDKEKKQVSFDIKGEKNE